MLEDVVDRGLANIGMRPHMAALLPTLISGIVTALDMTAPPPAPAPAAAAGSGAATQARALAPALQRRSSSMGRSRSGSGAASQGSPSDLGDMGAPDQLVQLINKLILQVSKQMHYLVCLASQGSRSTAERVTVLSRQPFPDTNTIFPGPRQAEAPQPLLKRPCFTGTASSACLQAPGDLRTCLHHVEPLPPLPGLEAAQQLLDSLRAGVPLSAELTHFVGRAASLPGVLRSRALASLELGLIRRQEELLSADCAAGCALESQAMLPAAPCAGQRTILSLFQGD